MIRQTGLAQAIDIAGGRSTGGKKCRKNARRARFAQ